MKSIKLSDYFKLVKPNYVYIKIIPHKSIRNYNSSNIAKAVAHTYRGIDRRIRKEKKKIFFETSFKICYIVDIENGNANFYFLVPKFFVSGIIEKAKEIWSKATVLTLEGGITPFSKEAEHYQVSYKKEDSLSLAIDKKSNEPLNSILSVMDIMKDNDRVTLVYNFMPRSQLGWLQTHDETMDRARKDKCLDKTTMTLGHVLKVATGTLLSIMDGILDVLNDFVGGDKLGETESLYSSIMGVLNQQHKLSTNTHSKKEQTILPTQISVVSSSEDPTRRENNALSVCQSFRTLDEDNELKYSKAKNKCNIEDYSFNTKSSIFSTNECSNFLQIPGRLLLMQHGIKFIKTEETVIPKVLRERTKRLGESTYKGNEVEAFLDNDWDFGNCGLIPIGGMGAGKTTFISNYVRDCIEADEGVIVIDFIKNCELSEDIAKITPKDKLIKINLAKESDIQSFAYNEMKITSDMTVFKKLDLASMQSDQLMNLIDGVSTGDPLSSGMRRLFNSASTVVSVQGLSSLKNTIECLENYKKRAEYINNLSQLLRDNLEEEISTLSELDEYNKMGELVGTKSSKISFILDRVDLLRSNFKLKYMYKANSDNNIDFVQCMDENKVVLIQMRDGDFPTKLQKNILVTYFITKIWLASQIRGMTQLKPSRCNLIIDEIFQAPTAMNVLEYILTQARKFSLKPILSLHYIRQVEKIFESLLTSNASFMMLKGCTEDDFNHFKSKLDEQFTYDDLKDMKRYHSLNLICHSEGYSSFITKLPPPI